MIKINLLPVRAAQKKEKLRSQLVIFFLCILLVMIGCGALYAQKMTAISQTKEEIAQIKRQNDALKKKIGQVKDFEKKKNELEQKLEVLKSLKAGKSGPVHLLDELSSSLPDQLWLTKFKESGGGIELSGIADSENTVADFMKRLDGSPYYQNIELKVTEQTQIAGYKMQKFTLSCRVQTPPTN